MAAFSRPWRSGSRRHQWRTGAVALLLLALAGAVVAAARLSIPDASRAAQASISLNTSTNPALDVTAYAASFAAADAVIGLSQAGQGSSLTVMNASDGRTLGIVATSHYPMTISRPSRSQILVSDYGPTGGRLFLLDTTNSLATVGGALALPERVRYTAYSQGLLLSADETLLYYLQHVDCGVQCDDVGVGVVDLDARTLAATIALPRGCGFAQLTRDGADVIAMCPNGSALYRIASGTRSDLGSVPSSGWPVYGSRAASGELFVVTQEGKLIVFDPAGARVTLTRNLLSAGQRLNGLQRWRLPNGTIALGVLASADPVMVDMLLLDPNDWSSRTYLLPRLATNAGVMRTGEMLVLHDGRIARLDALSGLVRGLPAVAPAAIEALIGTSD